MSQLWKMICFAAVLLLGAMAVLAIWYDDVPEALGKAFVTIVVVGLALMATQSLLKPARKSPPE